MTPPAPGLRCAMGPAEARAYVREAGLQRGVARRLAALWHGALAGRLPSGPRLDLGGGAGTLALALARKGCPPLEVVDCNVALLRLATGLQVRPWDLDRGLPVAEPALLASNFALHWLARPLDSLGQWCRALRPGGQLLLAVPTSGSFTGWRQAAQGANVAWTGLPLPSAQQLQGVLADQLRLRHCCLLQRSQRWPSPLAFFRHLKRSGLTGGAGGRLGPAELRRLDRCWPRGPQGNVAVEWEVLVALAERLNGGGAESRQGRPRLQGEEGVNGSPSSPGSESTAWRGSRGWRQSPRRPPCLARSRTPPISMAGSRALAMS